MNIAPLDATTSGIVLGVSTSTDGSLMNSSSTDMYTSSTVLVASTTLEKISGLTVVTYTIGGQSADVATSTHVGLTAEEVERLFPDLVSVDQGGIKSVSYTNFIPYILKAIKDLAVQIAEFKNKITTNELHTNTVCVSKKNGTETCFDGDQLDKLLQNNATSTQEEIPSISAPETSTSTQGDLNSSASSTTDIVIDQTTISTTTVEVLPENTPVSGNGTTTDAVTNVSIENNTAAVTEVTATTSSDSILP
jgi:hypothetical protein